jgi:hypothetical protein
MKRRYSGMSSVPRIRCAVTMMLFSGVRSSWVMRARNSLFVRFGRLGDFLGLFELGDEGARQADGLHRVLSQPRAGAHDQREVAVGVVEDRDLGERGGPRDIPALDAGKVEQHGHIAADTGVHEVEHLRPRAGSGCQRAGTPG